MEHLGAIFKNRSYNHGVKVNKTFGPKTSPSQLDQEIQAFNIYSSLRTAILLQVVYFLLVFSRDFPVAFFESSIRFINVFESPPNKKMFMGSDDENNEGSSSF